MLVRTCIPGRLYTYRNMCFFFFLMGDLIRQGPRQGVACEISIVWCIYLVCHFAANSGELRSNVVFSCSLVNLTVLREICAPQTHPRGSVRSTHPMRGVRVTRAHPSRIP